jgi:hypothetical protein
MRHYRRSARKARLHGRIPVQFGMIQRTPSVGRHLGARCSVARAPPLSPVGAAGSVVVALLLRSSRRWSGDSLLARLRGRKSRKTERNWAQRAVPGPEWKPARGKPSTGIRAARCTQCPHGRTAATARRIEGSKRWSRTGPWWRKLDSRTNTLRHRTRSGSLWMSACDRPTTPRRWSRPRLRNPRTPPHLPRRQYARSSPGGPASPQAVSHPGCNHRGRPALR